MKKFSTYHPILFAIYPTLFIFSQSKDQITITAIMLPAIFSLILTALVWIGFRLIIKDSKKAAIATTLFLLAFFSYGYAYSFIGGITIGGFRLGRHALLIPFSLILVAAGAYQIKRTGNELSNATRILNVIAAALVLISITDIAMFGFKTYREEARSIAAMKRVRSTAVNKAGLPDIYYIILDGHARSDTLKEFFDYDDREFIESLEMKGFYVAPKSRSNYAMTSLSLPSSLNMEYINYLSDNGEAKSSDRMILNRMVKKSKLVDLLRSKGYQYVHISSGYGATDYNIYADRNIVAGKRGLTLTENEVIMVIAQKSMLGPFKGYLDAALFYAFSGSLREKISGAFDELGKIEQRDGPKFIFAHILLPHPPYLFGRNGEPIAKTQFEITGDKVWQDKKYYLDQLIYADAKTSEVVDRILKNSKREPIIIIQADHGPASTGNWDRPGDTLFNERMRIFNAYHLPGKGNDELYPTISPVNTFRLIANVYLNERLEMLEDKSYFSTYEKPYTFVDVTDRVK